MNFSGVALFYSITLFSIKMYLYIIGAQPTTAVEECDATAAK